VELGNHLDCHVQGLVLGCWIVQPQQRSQRGQNLDQNSEIGRVDCTGHSCFLYILANTAYFLIVPIGDIKHSGELIAALFFG
jgi:hypothetical protein